MTVRQQIGRTRSAVLAGVFVTVLCEAPALAGPTVDAWVATATRTESHWRVLHAAGAWTDNNPKEVLELLKDVDPRYVPAALLRAHAHAHLKKPAAAAAALDAARPTPNPCQTRDLLGEAIVRLRADMLVRPDLAASAELELGLPVDPGPLAVLRGQLAKAGHDALARRAGRRLLVERPEHPGARQLATRLGPDGVKAVLGTARHRLLRVRALLKSHENEAAAAEARALGKDLGDKSPHACELRYIEGKALRKLRHYPAAQRALVRARLFCAAAGEVDIALRSALLDAQVRSIRGQAQGTAYLAKWIEKTAPGHAFVDDAWWLHATTLEHQGQVEAARVVFRRLADDYPNTDHAPDAAWRLAFAAIRTGDANAARPYLDQILSRPTRPMAAARARYWRAELARRAKDRSAAHADFEALVLEPSFYGWMALDRLAKVEPKWVEAWKARLLELRNAPDVEILADHLGPARAAVQKAARLIRSDFTYEWARSELDKVACQVKGDAGRRALWAAYSALGFGPDAQMIAQAREPAWREGPVTPARMRDLRLAYSRALRDILRFGFDRVYVEELFLTALVREESAFDPRTVGGAGTIGLTQLMPATAVEAYSDVFHRQLKDIERLNDPSLNLLLGAHVLRQSLGRFQFSEPLALAAYHGGPEQAQRFIPDQPIDFDIWVETLTVEETRRYIKRVTETWGIYRWLYDADAPFVDLPDSVGGPKWQHR